MKESSFCSSKKVSDTILHHIEMLCFYFMGWADDEELAQHIKKLKEAEEKKRPP